MGALQHGGGGRAGRHRQPRLLSRLLRPDPASRSLALRGQSKITRQFIEPEFQFKYLFFEHYLYPGNVNWTEEGFDFAWRLKLIDRDGGTDFYIVDSVANRREKIDPKNYLSGRQRDYVRTTPRMILQFAHHLRDRHGTADRPVRVYARSYVSLNGRKTQAMVDPTVDLAQEEFSLRPVRWILPLRSRAQDSPDPPPRGKTQDGHR